MFSSNCIVKKYARNRKRAACMFFRSAKSVYISPRYDGLADRVHSARGQLSLSCLRMEVLWERSGNGMGRGWGTPFRDKPPPPPPPVVSKGCVESGEFNKRAKGCVE